MPKRIDIKNAKILWKTENTQVQDFVVLDVTESEIEPSEYGNFESSDGCICDGWPYENGSNGPEGIFAQLLLFDQVPSNEMIQKILSELGKIEQAEWARRMANAIQQELTASY